MKHLLRIFVALFLVLVIGCSTTRIGLQVLKPAQFDMPPLKSIAVFDCDFTGSWEFWYEKRTLTIEDLAKEILAQVLGIERRKPRPDPKTAFPGSEAAEMIRAHYVSNGHYTIPDKSRMVSTARTGMPTIISDAEAIRLGQQLKVDAILLGTASYSVSDEGEWYTVVDKVEREVTDDSGHVTKVTEEIERREFRAKRRVMVDFSYRIVNVTSGAIIVTTSFQRGQTLVSEDQGPVSAFQKLPDWRPAVASIVDGIAGTIVIQTAPHYVNQSREIFRGKSSSLKRAQDLARHGMLDDAKVIWQRVVDNKSAYHVKDRLAAYYNLGVCAETVDDLDTAERYFDRCFKLTGKERFLHDKSRVRARREELARLQQQNAL